MFRKWIVEVTMKIRTREAHHQRWNLSTRMKAPTLRWRKIPPCVTQLTNLLWAATRLALTITSTHILTLVTYLLTFHISLLWFLLLYSFLMHLYMRLLGYSWNVAWLSNVLLGRVNLVLNSETVLYKPPEHLTLLYCAVKVYSCA